MNIENFIISIINEIYKRRGNVTKKAVQKIAYISQIATGEKYSRFIFHYYGPYSQDIDFLFYSLQCDGLISINTDVQPFQITLTDEAQPKPIENTRIKGLLEMLGDWPDERLEALSITLWVGDKVNEKEDVEAVIKKIKGDEWYKINEEALKECTVINLFERKDQKGD